MSGKYHLPKDHLLLEWQSLLLYFSQGTEKKAVISTGTQGTVIISDHLLEALIGELLSILESCFAGMVTV